MTPFTLPTLATPAPWARLLATLFTLCAAAALPVYAAEPKAADPAVAAAAAEAAEQALRAVRALAQVNGQALACQDTDTARRAKALMLTHAPKTPRFGQAYEEGTNQAYLAQTQGGKACPTAEAALKQLQQVQLHLNAAMPVRP